MILIIFIYICLIIYIYVCIFDDISIYIHLPISMCWFVFQEFKLPEDPADSLSKAIVVRWKNMQSGWEWLLGKESNSV